MANRAKKTLERKTFSRIPNVMEIPNLIETQLKSYREFLYRDNNPTERPIKDLRGELRRQIFEVIDGKELTKNATSPKTRRIVLDKGTVVSRSHFSAIEELPIKALAFKDSDKIFKKIVADYNKPGLTQAFESVFPIKGKDGTELQFVDYTLGRPKFSISECVDRGMTYAAPLRVKVRLEVKIANEADGKPELQEVREEDIYLGEMPLITPKGTFISNGAERVVVSQLHRSPGPAFSMTPHQTGKKLVRGQILPNRGSWLEFESDVNSVVSVMIDRKKKMTASTLMRAFGLDTTMDIYDRFFKFEKVTLNRNSVKNLAQRILARDVVLEDTGEVIDFGVELDGEQIKRMLENKVDHVMLVRIEDVRHFEVMIHTVQKDSARTSQEAINELYSLLRPGDYQPPKTTGEPAEEQSMEEREQAQATQESAIPVATQPNTESAAGAKNARAFFENLFLKPKRYDLSRVGRYRMNRKLGINVPLETVTLTLDDLVGVMKYLLDILADKDVPLDDIDHLGNRRVRTIGELLENQVRSGLARMERVIRERMSILDIENMMPKTLVNSKPIMSVLNEFFGRSQLSQFLDQVNPLSELTHKRRMSALGPGGLNRERAGFEVRDVHHTHYGRVCPIETPEGTNIGLILSLSTFARINDVGFIETPYRQVVQDDEEKAAVTSDIIYLEALDEDNCVIAQANAPVNEKNQFIEKEVSVRSRGEYQKVAPDQVNYMDVLPMQLVSISASLIPFLEHDDANRALMGSNMQRQAIPLMRTEAPYIGTGMEKKAAQDSGIVVRARRPGKVTRVTADRVEIKPDIKGKEQWWDWDEYDFTSSQASDFLEGLDVYRLTKFCRSNQNTTINQKPIVSVGDKVEKGDVLADGPATENGELALGKNVLVAFMSWEGYNFEDAILVSERISRDHVFTSIHIEEAKIEARDTKLGEEEITRDIPNVSEDALKNLDESGIIRIGAPVKPGDILVGKISPKGKIQTSNVEKLLRAIFGKRADDVRDISLKASPGTYGTVVDVKVFSRKNRGETRSRQEEEQSVNRLNRERDSLTATLYKQWESAIREFVKDEVLLEDLENPETGGILLKKGSEFNEANLKKIQEVRLADAEIPIEWENDLERLNRQFKYRLEEINQEYDKQIDYIKTGDNLPPGVIKMVKVYIAKKKRLSVGDKMAGRHGNKGVVSRVLPLEDMPHLEDGTPVDIILNPLGVPSRMNVGQILETHLGWAAKFLSKPIETPVFDGAREYEILAEMKLAESIALSANYIEEGESALAHSALLAAAQSVRAMEEIREQFTEENEKDFEGWHRCAGSLLKSLEATLNQRRANRALFDAIHYALLTGLDAYEDANSVDALKLEPVEFNFKNVETLWANVMAMWAEYAEVSESDSLKNKIAKLNEASSETLGGIDDINFSNLDAIQKQIQKYEDQLMKLIPLPQSDEVEYLLGKDDINTQEVRGEELRKLIELITHQKYGEAKLYSQHHGLAGTAIPSDVQKVRLIDGKTGEYFERETTVGIIYMMKLNHLVDDKIHARAIGPYSLVTQQPLGGKAQSGGQRLGEMEVWALEAYGAAHILQELLTFKSDDTVGRNKIYEAIVKGEEAKSPGLPESFYVLVKEIESLGLSITLRESEATEQVKEPGKEAEPVPGAPPADDTYALNIDVQEFDQ